MPRPIRGGTTLSQHGVGRAVDINPESNLRLRSLVRRTAQLDALLRVIQAVTGVDLDSERTYQSQRDASDNFRATFTADWMAAHGQELTVMEGALRRSLRRYHKDLREVAAERGRAQDAGIKANLFEFMNQIRVDAAGVAREVKSLRRLDRDIKMVRGTLSRVARTGSLEHARGHRTGVPS